MVDIAVSVVILCNNLNWQYSERCTAPVAEVHQTHNGFYGTLESGVEWKQTHYGSFMIYQMEDVKWITDGYTVTYI